MTLFLLVIIAWFTYSVCVVCSWLSPRTKTHGLEDADLKPKCWQCRAEYFVLVVWQLTGVAHIFALVPVNGRPLPGALSVKSPNDFVFWRIANCKYQE